MNRSVTHCLIGFSITNMLFVQSVCDLNLTHAVIGSLTRICQLPLHYNSRILQSRNRYLCMYPPIYLTLL
jgi:hypothetical protein